MLEPLWPGASRVNSFVLLPIFTGPVTMAFFGLFPDGRFVPRWAPWLVLTSFIVLPISAWGERRCCPSR